MDRCKHVLRLHLARDHSILNPQKWHCAVCNTTESVWACLSCAHVACGRYIEEHALRHYEEQRHPLALEVNELYVFCYACDDYVLNDNATGDLKLLRQTLSAIKTQKYDDDGDLAATTRSGRSRRSSAMNSLVVAGDANNSSSSGSGGLGSALRAQELQLRDEDRMFTALWHRRRALLGRAFRAWLSQTSGGRRLLEEERRREEEEEKRREVLEKRRALKRQKKEELEKAPPRKSSRLQKPRRRGRPPKQQSAVAAVTTTTTAAAGASSSAEEKTPAKKRKMSGSPARAAATSTTPTTTSTSTSSTQLAPRKRGRPKSTATAAAPLEKAKRRGRPKGPKTPTATTTTPAKSSAKASASSKATRAKPGPKPKAKPGPKPKGKPGPKPKAKPGPKPKQIKAQSKKQAGSGPAPSKPGRKRKRPQTPPPTPKTRTPKKTQSTKTTTTSSKPRGRPKSSTTKSSKSSNKNSDSPSPIKRRPTVTPGVTGLRNLGNTCYMNSILQVLSHLHLFRECFLRLDLSQALELLASAVGGKLVGANLGPGRPPSSASSPGAGGAKGKLQNPGGAGRGRGRGGAAVGPGRGGGVGGSGGGGPGRGLSGGGGAGLGRSMELIQHKEPSSAHLSLCHQLHALFQVMWSGKWALVSPFAMLHSVWQLIPAFRGYAQQDAQEFLCELLDKVQRELESSTSGGGGGGGVVDGHSRGEVMHHGTGGGSEKRLVKQVLSVVNTIFHGQLLSQVTCLACEQRSNTVEPFWDLSLEFPQRYHSNSKEPQMGQCLLTEMLAKFTETEALEGNIYACEQCNLRVPSPEKHRRSSKSVVLTEAQKQLMIHKLPHVLRLHLKRFRWSGRNHREKIGVHVAFEQTLNMEPYCCRGSSPAPNPAPSGSHFLYELSAVVMHHGKGFGSGHYTAYCYNTEGGFWVHCNDSKMNICSVEEVCKAQAYILFYTQLLSQDKVKSAA